MGFERTVTMTRSHFTACTLGLLFLGTSAAQAGNANACLNRDLERMDYSANPPEHGDNTFFPTVVAQTGNVTLLYPAKKRRRVFPQRLYRMRADFGGTACSNAYLNGRTYFMPTSVTPPAGAASLQGAYKTGTTYPDPDTTYAGGGGVNAGFASASAYEYQQWPANDSGTPQTPTAACTAALSAPGLISCPGGSCSSSSNISACTSCLSTAGYWLNA